MRFASSLEDRGQGLHTGSLTVISAAKPQGQIGRSRHRECPADALQADVGCRLVRDPKHPHISTPQALRVGHQPGLPHSVHVVSTAFVSTAGCAFRGAPASRFRRKRWLLPDREDRLNARTSVPSCEPPRTRTTPARSVATSPLASHSGSDRDSGRARRRPPPGRRCTGQRSDPGQADHVRRCRQ